MSTTTTSFTTALDQHLQTFALGLIAYAETDSLFLESLAAQTHSLPSTPVLIKPEVSGGSPHLIPASQEDAADTAAWLIAQLHQQPTRARHTIALLETWAEPYRVPKDVIIGIVGLAIMGPTLGIMEKKKKKKKSALTTVISQHWYETHTPAELTALTARVSQQVIARELTLSGGNVYQLHPDSAAWCMEEAYTKLYLAKATELSELYHVAKSDRLPHSTMCEDDTLVAVAISPAVNDTFVDEFSVENLSQ